MQHTAFYNNELRYAEVGSLILPNFPLPTASRHPILSPFKSSGPEDVSDEQPVKFLATWLLSAVPHGTYNNFYFLYFFLIIYLVDMMRKASYLINGCPPPLPLTDRIFYSYMELAFSFPFIPHVELFQAHWSYAAITCAWHA